MIYRVTEGKLPPRNFLLPVAEANPKRGRKWETYIKTWERCDENPDTRANDYKLWRWHYNRNYDPEWSVKFVESRIRTYKSIKENGFIYKGWIIRAYPPPWNFVDNGHTRVSILRHLEPDAVVEVAGYGHPPHTGRSGR